MYPFCNRVYVATDPIYPPAPVTSIVLSMVCYDGSMRLKHIAKKYRLGRLLVGLIYTLGIVGVVLFVPPRDNVFIIAGFMVLCGGYGAYVVSCVTRERLYVGMAGMSVFAFLLMNYLATFNVMNNVLLVLLIGGIVALARTR